jgi:hypothetical protein
MRQLRLELSRPWSACGTSPVPGQDVKIPIDVARSVGLRRNGAGPTWNFRPADANRPLGSRLRMPEGFAWFETGQDGGRQASDHDFAELVTWM